MYTGPGWQTACFRASTRTKATRQSKQSHRAPSRRSSARTTPSSAPTDSRCVCVCVCVFVCLFVCLRFCVCVRLWVFAQTALSLFAYLGCLCYPHRPRPQDALEFFQHLMVQLDRNRSALPSPSALFSFSLENRRQCSVSQQVGVGLCLYLCVCVCICVCVCVCVCVWVGALSGALSPYSPLSCSRELIGDDRWSTAAARSARCCCRCR
jgi:hypothetical protein